jgi:predicted type IV restriction endonuclease
MTRAQAKILIQDARSKQRVKQVAEAVRYSFDTGKWTVRLNNGQWLVARTFEGLVKNIGGMSELKADQLWAYLDKNRNQWITFVAETSSVKKRGVSFA